MEHTTTIKAAAANGTSSSDNLPATATQNAAFAASDTIVHGFNAAQAGVNRLSEAVQKSDFNAAAHAGILEVAEAADRVAEGFSAGAKAAFGAFGAGQIIHPQVRSQGADAGFFDSTKEPVVLRIEIATSAEGKLLRLVSWLMTLGTLIASLSLVLKHRINIRSNLAGSYLIVCVAIDSIVLMALLLVGGIVVSRLVMVKRIGHAWSRRRAVVAWYGGALLVIVSFQVMFCLIATAVLLPGKCGWRLRVAATFGYLQWSCWNLTFSILLMMTRNNALYCGPVAEGTVSLPIIMDAPQPSTHLVVLFWWIPLQVALSMVFWGILDRLPSTCDAAIVDACNAAEPLSNSFFVVGLVFILLYILAYFHFSRRAQRDLENQPYVEVRFLRMISGLQRQLVMPIFTGLCIAMVAIFAALINTCWRVFEGWLGLPSITILGACLAGCSAFFTMPKIPDSQDEILASWLQEFSWTAKGQQTALAARNAHLASSTELAKRPMFCIETSVKMLYFSWLCYRIQYATVVAEATEAGLEAYNTSLHSSLGSQLPSKPPISATPAEAKATPTLVERIVTADTVSQAAEATTDTMEAAAVMDTAEQHPSRHAPLINPSIADALALYDLTDYEVISDTKTDTLAVLAWGNGTIVLAFRGTMSLVNARTNLKFFTQIHPPRRWHSVSTLLGVRFIKSFVRVHKGFYAAWTANNYSSLVVERVEQVVKSMGGSSAVQFFITGHSLGGALGVLAAHELKTRFPDLSITNYTFGMPRVGNRAFAMEYNSMIPNHFAIICGNDPVSRIPRGMQYKRAGGRVAINLKGDVIVSPTFLEMQLSINKGELKDHKIHSYRLAFMQVIKAAVLREDGAVRGASDLAATLDLNNVLKGAHLEVDALKNPELEVLSQEQALTSQNTTERKGTVVSRLGDAVSCGDYLTMCGCGGKSARQEGADGVVENV